MWENDLGLLASISNSREKLGCYSGLVSSNAHVFAPANVQELIRIFAFAREKKCRITFRAGGHSFDGQAIGDDLVISLLRLDHIEVDVANKKVTVGPGAKWGAILSRLEPHGLVPAVTVTTEHATAGGTLSGDCLSRFSPAYGKEGTWIESFDLLLVSGERLSCREPREGIPYAQYTREERAFCGVIGGLGYLGAVVSITYRLLTVAASNGKIGVRTRVRKYRTFRTLAKELIPVAKQTCEERSDPNDATKLDAIYSALFVPRKGDPYALLMTSTFTSDPERARMLLHRPNLGIRPFAEWILRSDSITRFVWPLFYRLYEEDDEFVDDLHGFTFFMDGNVRAKEIAHRLGVELKTVQQTFIVPSGPGTKGGWDAAEDDLVEWLDYAAKFFRERDLQPALHDVLFLPVNERFLLSASAGLAGFAVSYAFETSNPETIAKVKQAFTDLADILHDVFQGRVYLVKNVCARAETLQKMYGANARDFFLLKKELDPDLVLRNAFLERTFGPLLNEVAGARSDVA